MGNYIRINIPEEDCPRNWKEDYEKENGNYINTCITCGKLFGGHKRRVVCKECATGGIVNV